jgi:hypothetical protein
MESCIIGKDPLNQNLFMFHVCASFFGYVCISKEVVKRELNDWNFSCSRENVCIYNKRRKRSFEAELPMRDHWCTRFLRLYSMWIEVVLMDYCPVGSPVIFVGNLKFISFLDISEFLFTFYSPLKVSVTKLGVSMYFERCQISLKHHSGAVTLYCSKCG